MKTKVLSAVGQVLFFIALFAFLCFGLYIAPQV